MKVAILEINLVVNKPMLSFFNVDNAMLLSWLGIFG